MIYFSVVFFAVMSLNPFSNKFAGKFFEPFRLFKNSRLAIYRKLVNSLYCIASSVSVILGDPAAASREDAMCSAE